MKSSFRREAVPSGPRPLPPDYRSIALTSNHPPPRHSLPARLRAVLSRNPELYGYCIMCVSAIAHATLSFFVRFGSTRYNFPVFSTLLIRSIIEGSLAFSYLFKFVDYQVCVGRLSRSQWCLILLRGLTGTLSLLCQIIALSLISIGNAVTILLTCPAITMVMAALLLGESIQMLDVISLIMSSTGVLFVSQPSFLSSSSPHSQGTQQSTLGVLVALMAAFFSSSVSVITRSLGHDVNFMINVCSLTICTFVTSIIFSRHHEFHNIFNNHPGLFVNVIAGFCGYIAQSSLSKGLQYCRAGPALLVRSLTIPFSYAYGLLFLGESPSLLMLGGVFMILLAAVTVSLKEFLTATSSANANPVAQQTDYHSVTAQTA